MSASRFKSIRSLSGIVLISLVWLWACDLRADHGILCPTTNLSNNQDSKAAPCHSTASESEQEANHCFHCLETADFDTSSGFPSLLKQSIEIVNIPANILASNLDTGANLDYQSLYFYTIYLDYKTDTILQNSQRFRI